MEAGHCCPITMTNAAVPVLLQQPDVAAEWLPRILPHNYDPSFAPPAAKTAVTLGMGMTEKQGGTDVRAIDDDGRAIGGGGPAANTASPATSGSCRRRCRTPSSCWRRRRTA